MYPDPPPRARHHSHSSSLAGMEIAIPPGGKRVSAGYDPPPLSDLQTYGSKPLPPAPDRRSMASSTRSELNQALRTPLKQSTDNQYTATFDWDDEDEGQDNISVMLDASVISHDSHRHVESHKHSSEDDYRSSHSSERLSQSSQESYRPHRAYWPHHRHQHQVQQQQRQHLDPYLLPELGSTPAFPSTPPDEVLLPQAKASVPKILQIAGHGDRLVTKSSPRSPTGHNSSQKISQMMGLDTAVPTRHSSYSLSSLDDSSSLSPTSSGSVYSQAPELTNSESDDILYPELCPNCKCQKPKLAVSRERLPESHQWMPHTPTSVKSEPKKPQPTLQGSSSGHGQMFQSPVQINKPTRPHSVKTHDKPTSPRYQRDGNVDIDLYHATTTQIARSTQRKSDALVGHGRALSDNNANSPLRLPAPWLQHKKSGSSASFLSRAHLSKVRSGLPAERRTGRPARAVSSPGLIWAKSSHVSQSHWDSANHSVFEPDTEEDAEPSTLARMLRRGSGAADNGKLAGSPGRELPSSPYSSGLSHTGSPSRDKADRRSRRESRSDTAAAAAATATASGRLQKTSDQLHGLVAQAKGIMGKSERKRDSLKNRIRIIPEGAVLGEITGDDFERP